VTFEEKRRAGKRRGKKGFSILQQGLDRIEENATEERMKEM
jgi:hypothetical protein